MALLTTIENVPLYSTVQEALAWAKANGLTGYHTHNFQGKVGYMGGTTHQKATRKPTPENSPGTVDRPPQVRQVRNQQRNTQNNYSSGSSSGGGGY